MNTTSTLVWNGLTISVTYTPSISESFSRIHGYPQPRLEIKCNEPLPVTDTGYLSYYPHYEVISSHSSPAEYVREILDEAAKSSCWKDYVQQRQQLSLFN